MGISQHERISWDVNDLAFLIYADYRSLSRGQVAEIFSTSAAAISQQMMKIKNPESYSQRTQDKVNKAGVLEMKIRTGMYPDHLKTWNEKITKFTGITYGMPHVPEELEESEPEDQVAEEVVEQLPPVLQLTISTEAIIKLIRVWKGKSE